MFKKMPHVPEKIQVHISGKGKILEISTFEPSAFEPPSFITEREYGQRKIAPSSKNLPLFRKNKIRYTTILAPRKIKENTKNGFSLKEYRNERKQNSKTGKMALIRQDLFS